MILSLNHAKILQKERLTTAARIAATEHIQIIEGARQLLVSLSTSPFILYPDENCSLYLQQVLNKYQRYNNIALANLHGDAICNAAALPEQKIVNVSDRYFFKEVIKTNEFTVGEYSLSKTTKQPVISLGYPVHDYQGRLIGIIYSSLDLDWLKNLVSSLSLGDNSVLLITDKNGKILASNQNSFQAGSLLSDKGIVLNLKSDSGLIEPQDTKNYFFAYNQIGGSSSNPFAFVGLPKATVYQKPNEDFAKSLLFSGLIALLSLTGGWYIGNSLITKLVMAVQKVDQLRQDFVSLVSHQLRTPLTAIKYFCEILLSESSGKLNKKQKEFITDTLTSASRLSQLVGTLLDIGRLEEGKMLLNFKEVSVEKLLENSMKDIAPFIKKEGLKLSRVKKRGVPSNIFVDEKLMIQAVSNLLSNAVKYSDPKSLIEIILSKSNNGILFEIKNRGIVILPEDKSHIFSKFYRSTMARKKADEGSGLGLYLTKLIIESHGGKIWFESDKNSTSFFFTLEIK
ncbi:MAG: sensor histidine kinase [Candidatus Levybacteria bacterium]|nr:sensor histidine kinase [Candidatus Levybacteria bacterium]